MDCLINSHHFSAGRQETSHSPESECEPAAPHIKAIAEGDDSSLKVFTCEDKRKSDDVCVLDRKSRKLESKSLAKITELVKDEKRAESRQGH